MYSPFRTMNHPFRVDWGTPFTVEWATPFAIELPAPGNPRLRLASMERPLQARQIEHRHGRDPLDPQPGGAPPTSMILQAHSVLRPERPHSVSPGLSNTPIPPSALKARGLGGLRPERPPPSAQAKGLGNRVAKNPPALKGPFIPFAPEAPLRQPSPSPRPVLFTITKSHERALRPECPSPSTQPNALAGLVYHHQKPRTCSSAQRAASTSPAQRPGRSSA
jgi:hypothetical protein